MENVFKMLEEIREKDPQQYVEKTQKIYQGLIETIDRFKKEYPSRSVKNSDESLKMVFDMVNIAETFIKLLEESKPIYDASKMIRVLSKKKKELEELLK